MIESETPAFVDRTAELRELREIATAGQPRIVLLYGRRRVGKTYLLGHAFEGFRTFYFLAGDSTPEINRAELLRELSSWAGSTFAETDYPTWRTVIRLFSDLAENDPLVVVMDEFQYLMVGSENIASQIVAVFDREVRNRSLVLVLCGSEVSTLEALLGGGQPLFGRCAWAAKLSPFDYRDAARMLPGRPPRELVTFYAVFGGTPLYLCSVRTDESLAQAGARLLLSPRGKVGIQLGRVMEQERGIRNTAEYNSILTAIAGGAVVISHIVDVTRIEAPAVRAALLVLEQLEYVWRERNFDAPGNARWRYLLADPALTFWYRFVRPLRSRLMRGDPSATWDSRVKPHLGTHIGHVFEHVCRQAFARYHAAWGLPDAAQWARWEGTDRNRRPIEIDIVARLDDGTLIAGECKWSMRPVSADLHRNLEGSLEDLAASGHGWAHQALDPARSSGFLYFSAAGFTPDFHSIAEADPRVRLLALEDLFPEVGDTLPASGTSSP